MIGCIIQARMGSSRLPGKVMEKLDQDNTVLSYVIRQLKHSKFLDDIVVATTSLKRDEVIVDFLEREGIKYFCGDEENVLDRYYQCAKKFSLTNILRITSDDPLVDPTIIDELIRNYQETDCDLASIETSVENNINNTKSKNLSGYPYPIGLNAQIFSFSALEKTWKNAKLPSEREHVSPYMMKNSDIFRQFHLRNPIKIPPLRLTIDKEEDLELSDDHWEIINFLREYYEEYQIAPAVRVLTKAVGKKLGADKGNSKYLYELFPYGPAKQACKFAGLPKPTGCV